MCSARVDVNIAILWNLTWQPSSENQTNFFWIPHKLLFTQPYGIFLWTCPKEGRQCPFSLSCYWNVKNPITNQTYTLLNYFSFFCPCFNCHDHQGKSLFLRYTAAKGRHSVGYPSQCFCTSMKNKPSSSFPSHTIAANSAFASFRSKKPKI